METLVVRSPRQTVSLLRNRRRRPQFERDRDPAATSGPKPSEVYGFVGSITTVIATAVYLAWAYTPEPWLHSLGITYYPTKYWAVAAPAFVMVAVALSLIAYVGSNFIATPPPTSFTTIFVANVPKLSSTGTAVDATVASTCKEVAASDLRVNPQMCVSQLGNHRAAADADAWGLAKVASLAGVNYTALAADDVKALQAGNPSVPMRPALAKCAAAYSEAGVAFAAATDEINARSYAAGRKKLDEVLAQAQGCNTAFGIHGVTLPQPLAQHTVDSIQIAIIAGAITSLIK